MKDEYWNHRLYYHEPVSVLKLSTRAENALGRNNIIRVSDLVRKMEDGSILEIRNIGRVSLHQIVERLNIGMYQYKIHPSVKEAMRSKEERKVIKELKEISENLKEIVKKHNVSITS